jgi:hypothetical protein
MKIVLPAHQQTHAPVANSVGAPICRRAGDGVLLSAHKQERCASDKFQRGPDQTEKIEPLTAGAPLCWGAGGKWLIAGAAA